MTDAIGRYLTDLQSRISSLAADERPSLERAADACAAAIAAKGVVHVYDTGHLISRELIHRTGGLVAFTALSFQGVLDNHNLLRATEPQSRTREERLEAERSLLAWVFAQGTLRAGDVLIIGSVSGTGMGLVELALQARAHGMTVVALTARAHSGRLAPQHPSGRRLYEVAEVVLDNHAEYGDAFLQIGDLDRKVAPLSGIGAAVLMWALTAGIVERLLERGVEPSVYTSINLPNGPAAVEAIERRYRERGY